MIVHDLNPLITEMLGIKLWYYGLTFVFGLMAVLVWFSCRRQRLGWTAKDVLKYVLMVSLSSLLFGRIFEIVVYEISYFLRNPAEIMKFWNGGMAAHGVMLGAIVMTYLYSRKRKTAFLRLSDELAIPAAIALGLGKIGCFINGQMAGRITEVAWAVKFPYVEGLRHPVALYDAFANFLIIPVLIGVALTKRYRRGLVSASFLFLHGSLHIITNLFSEYNGTYANMGRGQYLDYVLAGVGFAAVAWILKKRKPLRQTFEVNAVPAHEGGSSLLGLRFAMVIMAIAVMTIPSGWSRGAFSELRGIQKKNEYVVLLHGMGRTHHAMGRIKTALEKEGYHVVNVKYPSLKKPVHDIVADLDKIIESSCTEKDYKVNFVTHSLGGIVARAYLQQEHELNVGRVVMLAPPNNGSEVADYFKKMKIYKIVVGPNGQQLGTKADLLKTLKPVEYELGIIAGDRPNNPFYNSMIDGPNDGKVSVESTKADGMDDFVVVHSSHTFIMQRKHTIRQTINFLQHGKFVHLLKKSR